PLPLRRATRMKINILKTAATRTWAVIGLLAAAAAPLPAQPGAREFVTFDRFLQHTKAATPWNTRVVESKLRDHAAFEEMQRHLLRLYDGVRVRHSFVKDGNHFDCVPVEQQPSVRLLGLQSVAAAPPDSALPEPPSVRGDQAGDAAEMVTQIGHASVDEF